MTQIVARYKYDSWKKLSKQGMTKEKAMENFIEEFKKLAPTDAKAKLWEVIYTYFFKIIEQMIHERNDKWKTIYRERAVLLVKSNEYMDILE